jgi:hypothetical protein
MRRIRKFIFFLIIAIALAFVPCARAAATKAVVRAVRGGKAEFSKDKGKTWKPATTGKVLATNDLIRTDDNAVVDLFLGDNGPVVGLTKASELAIERLNVNDRDGKKIIDTRLDLKHGRILGKVIKTAAESRFEVNTPVGVASISEAEYSIAQDGQINVLSGTVTVVYVLDKLTYPMVTVYAGDSEMPPNSNPVAVGTFVSHGLMIESNLMDGIVINADGTMTVTLDNGIKFNNGPITTTTQPTRKRQKTDPN